MMDMETKVSNPINSVECDSQTYKIQSRELKRRAFSTSVTKVFY